MPISKTTGVGIVLGLLVLAAAGYLLLRPAPVDGLTSSAPASDAEAQFIALTAKLDPVTFDTKILTDPRFMALVDIRTAIVPETSGRTDPFSPLPGVVNK